MWPEKAKSSLIVGIKKATFGTIRLDVVRRRFVDGSRNHLPTNNADAVVFLPAFPAEEGGVKAGCFIVGMKHLSVEDDAAGCCRFKCGINLPCSGNKSVQFKRQKCAIAGTAPQIFATSHHR